MNHPVFILETTPDRLGECAIEKKPGMPSLLVWHSKSTSSGLV